MILTVLSAKYLGAVVLLVAQAASFIRVVNYFLKPVNSSK